MCDSSFSSRLSLDLFAFQFILVLSRERQLGKELYMKKLITIILALIMMLFTVPNQSAEQPPVTAVKTLQTAIVTRTEQVPETIETPAETALVSEVKETETVTEATPEEEPTIQEAVTEEHTEITEETVITELEEETIECIDEGDQSLAEYKPQIGGQPNHFENDTPTEIDDRPVEDYIGEGEDRPGGGIHF